MCHNRQVGIRGQLCRLFSPAFVWDKMQVTRLALQTSLLTEPSWWMKSVELFHNVSTDPYIQYSENASYFFTLQHCNVKPLDISIIKLIENHVLSVLYIWPCRLLVFFYIQQFKSIIKSIVYELCIIVPLFMNSQVLYL